MKNTLSYLLFVFFIFSSLYSFGQVSEREMAMSLGKQNGFSLKINTNDADKVEKLWKSYAKEFGRFKTNRKANELYREEAKVASINGKDKMDVYVKITAEEDQSYFQIWMDVGAGFLNSADHPEQYGKTMEMLTEFQFEANKSIIEDELDGEERMLTKQERELKQLKNDQEKYYKEIKQAEETILKMEENIKQNEKDQKAGEEAIKTQQNKIDLVKDKLEKLKKEKS